MNVLLFKTTTLLLLLVILAFITIDSKAEVTLDYPGNDIFKTNRALPGIPGTDLDEYKIELKAWSRKYNYTKNDLELSDETVNTYISSALGSVIMK